jgi:hypothetical protein
MNELNNYVDKLFVKYNHSRNIKELKAEILSNLEAKKADLMLSGLDEAEAILQAKQSITSIDDLIDGNVMVNAHTYQLEKMQTILLGTIIAWIVSIPGMLFQQIRLINGLLLLSVIIIGIVYLIMNFIKTEEIQRYINMNRMKLQSKIVWIIWAVYIAISFLTTTGMLFASNIWFARPVKITGPYQFANMLSYYIAPLFTIVIPIILTRINQLWMKHEV